MRKKIKAKSDMSRGQDAGTIRGDSKRLAIGRPNPAAGNGLLDRRHLLGAAATASMLTLTPRPAATAAGELAVEPWMRELGSPFTGYGPPSKVDGKGARIFTSVPGITRIRASR